LRTAVLTGSLSSHSFTLPFWFSRSSVGCTPCRENGE
jgi:hypothetical protein